MKKIRDAVSLLRLGGVIAFPTESSYGLGADATNTQAVRAVFELKRRPAEKSFPLIVSSLTMAQRFGIFSPRLLHLAKRFWPGPLTIILPARQPTLLASSLIGADGTIALRVSSHPLARSLARQLKKPIVATSANLAGERPCFSVEEIRAQLGLGEGQILDGGRLEERVASTMVREEDAGGPTKLQLLERRGRRLVVVREGRINANAIALFEDN
ncbi:threonylcarbamoyl-AMP synthase [Candidatus Uhrbacteria bacterium]|nr:threonylcarbamoyl-AMP synthase [Candidatus Uhrbacteria bacterium]